MTDQSQTQSQTASNPPTDQSQSHRVRRVLSDLGTDDTIEGLDVDITAGALKVLAPAILLGVAAFNFASSAVASVLPPGYGLIAPGVGAVVGACFPLAAFIVIHLTPAGRTPFGWLRRVVRYRSEPSQRTAFAEGEQSTTTLTQLARFHPDVDAAERVDGDLLGGVAVDPAHLSLASDSEWEDAASALGDAFTSLDFGVMIRTSGRPLDPAVVAAPYEERRDDPDVASNDALKQAVDIYANQWPSELQARKTAEREYQILVPVSIRDIQMQEQGILGELRDVPFIGGFYETVAGEASDLSPEEVRAEQEAELRDRLGAVERALGGVEETQCRRLSADDLARIIEEHWSGQRTAYDDKEASDRSRTRKSPIVTSTTQDTDSDPEETETQTDTEVEAHP